MAMSANLVQWKLASAAWKEYNGSKWWMICERTRMSGTAYAPKPDSAEPPTYNEHLKKMLLMTTYEDERLNDFYRPSSFGT